MNIKFSLLAVLLLCVSLAYASTLNLSGKWTGSLLTADSTNYPLTYNFTLTDSIITGTAQAAVGSFSIDSGKIDSANSFHFIVTINGVAIRHQGKFYNDSIGMDFNLNGATTHCKLMRAY